MIRHSDATDAPINSGPIRDEERAWICISGKLPLWPKIHKSPGHFIIQAGI